MSSWNELKERAAVMRERFSLFTNPPKEKVEPTEDEILLETQKLDLRQLAGLTRHEGAEVALEIIRDKIAVEHSQQRVNRDSLADLNYYQGKEDAFQEVVDDFMRWRGHADGSEVAVLPPTDEDTP